ncbi:unnamed protein product [Pedinophyceae sp. YPF-701]|nr:unnamed protein product [Pedinophyceae sp. YPF-701]
MSHGGETGMQNDLELQALVRGRRSPGTAAGDASSTAVGTDWPQIRRLYAIAMACAVAASIYADQNLTAPNLSAIAADLGLDEQERDTKLAGWVSAGFFAIGAPAALCVGWLDSRVRSRVQMLFIMVLIGEGPLILTAWVTRFWQFFVLRLMTGLAVGGCFPLAFSLLSDLVPAQHRPLASSAVQLSTGAGLAVGQAIAGFLGPWVGWRVPFVVVGIPSVALAALMLLTVREPARGAVEPCVQEARKRGLGEYREKATAARALRCCTVPSNALCVLQGIPGSLPWGVILVYLADYLAVDKGLGVQQATIVLLTFGVGGACGMLLGGVGGRAAYCRRKELLPAMMGLSAMCGTLPVLCLINGDLGGAAVWRVGLAAVAGAVAGVPGPGVRAVVMNVNEPELRGVAMALQSTADDVGKGFGPAMVAVLVSGLGRRAAFNFAVLGWVPCGLMMLSVACYFRRDEAAMEARMVANQAARLAGGAGDAGDVQLGSERSGGGPGSPLNSAGSVRSSGSGGAVGLVGGGGPARGGVRVRSGGRGGQKVPG